MSGPVTEIIDAVAKEYRISRNDILSDRRNRSIARPRQVVMWLACECTLLSYPMIGRQLRRDHTTVIHGRRAIDRLREMDRLMQHRTNKLRDRFNRERVG